MNAKEYLYSIREESREIEQLRDRIDELEQSLYPRGISYEGERVQTSHVDRFADTMALSVDYQNSLQDKLARLIDKRRKAQALIDRLVSSCERQIMDLYFLSLKKRSIDEIAEIIGHGRSTTYRYYKSALNHLDQVFDEKELENL